MQKLWCNLEKVFPLELFCLKERTEFESNVVGRFCSQIFKGWGRHYFIFNLLSKNPVIWPKLVQETSAASLLHSVPPGDDFTFKILLRVNRVNRALLGLFSAVYHYSFGLRVSVSCSRRVNVSQNKLPCPSSWWWRNTSGGDGAPRWCVFNSFWSDEASWLGGNELHQGLNTQRGAW